MSKNRNLMHAVNAPIPLDTLALGSELNGTAGTNRNAGNGRLIEADNDLEAIHAWLSEFEDSPQTYRNYRKDIERLLLWCLIELRKPFSSLNREDLGNYEKFLRTPTRSALWCGPRKPRSNKNWRPFVGPLSEISVQQSLSSIGAAFGYLSDAGYLLGNPVKLMRRRKNTVKNTKRIERFLDHATWEYLWLFIDTLPENSLREREQKARKRFLFSLLYLLGPRVQEVSMLQMADFKRSRGNWWCSILGKGNKREEIPVNSDMLAALIDYRRVLDLDDLPSPNEDGPLFRSIKGKTGVSANMIYRIVKSTVIDAALAIEDVDPEMAHTLRQSSTHWFRHTAITHQADSGIELRHLKKSARHNDINTTSKYLHAEDDRWHEDNARHHLPDSDSGT